MSRQYTIKENDTLGSLAYSLWRDSSRYREILDLNPEATPNPTTLELPIGSIITLPGTSLENENENQLQHPELSFTFRGGSLGNVRQSLQEISPWTNYDNYKDRLNSIPTIEDSQ